MSKRNLRLPILFLIIDYLIFPQYLSNQLIWNGKENSTSSRRKPVPRKQRRRSSFNPSSTLSLSSTAMTPVRASSVMQFPYAGMGASGLIMSPAISLWMVPPTVRREGVLEDGGFPIFGSSLEIVDSNISDTHLTPRSVPCNLNKRAEDSFLQKSGIENWNTSQSFCQTFFCTNTNT